MNTKLIIDVFLLLYEIYLDFDLLTRKKGYRGYDSKYTSDSLEKYSKIRGFAGIIVIIGFLIVMVGDLGILGDSFSDIRLYALIGVIAVMLVITLFLHKSVLVPLEGSNRNNSNTEEEEDF